MDRSGTKVDQVRGIEHAEGLAFMTHYVYRIYSGDDLLYVGCSNNPERRVKQHRLEKAWQEPITAVLTESYPTLAEAETAERVAIKTEDPQVQRPARQRRVCGLETKRHQARCVSNRPRR
jgi:predicted GIY-YIG superfamily endonuclease